MISISRQTPQPLLPRQRRQLILLTLLLACALLGLLRVAVSATSGGQGLPNLETLLAGNLDSQATRTPVPTAPRIIQWQWALGTATLAEDPGPAAPEEYVVYLPGVFRSDPVTWGQIEVEPEPPPASPTPNWPNGLDRLTNSKLGLHIVVNNDPFIMEFIRRARPRVVKAVDDLGWLAGYLATLPQDQANQLVAQLLDDRRGRRFGQTLDTPVSFDPHVPPGGHHHIGHTGVSQRGVDRAEPVHPGNHALDEGRQLGRWQQRR